MKLPTRKLVMPRAVVIGSATIVIVLAVLQYRWSNQVSEATSVRLADSLQMSMINWHLDFFRNISEICLTIRADPGGGTPGDLNKYMERFSEWKAFAGYPELVSNVYVLKSDEGTQHPVLRFNPDSRLLEPNESTPQLKRLREEIRQASPKLSSRANADPGSGFDGRNSPKPNQVRADGFYRVGDPLAGWRFEPTLPALIHPVAYDGIAGNAKRSMLLDWIVIELSAKVIQSQILPALTQAYFRGTDGLDYQVAVTSGSKSGHLIYSSDSDFGMPLPADADGTMDIFGRRRGDARGSPIQIFHKPVEDSGLAASVGVSWFPLLHGSSEEQNWQLVVRHRRGGPLGAFVAEMRRRDLAISFGALLLLVINMVMLIVTGNRAQRLAQLQMDFVMAVSHELRTPLTVIRSAAYNIAHGVVDGKQQLADYAAAIGAHAKQLSELVEQILLFAATRQGPQRYSLRPIQVSEAVDAALASTAELTKADGFTVDCEIDPSLPMAMGDSTALSQCLQNLITNALKYGGEKRWIGVRVQVVDSWIQVSISDRGLGIDSDDLPYIFEPFYRSPSVVASQIHGTGLGLPVAKSIAEAMKGLLTVSTVLGSGSTFTLRIPIADHAFRETEIEKHAATAR